MMKQLFFAISLLTAAAVSAQQADSSAIGFVSDSSRSLLYQAGQLSPVWMPVAMPMGVNRLQLEYTLAKGNYIPATDATQQGTTRLHTEGKTTLGTVHLWGAFSYTRTTEDSTRFAHQTRNNPTTPYYFGSPAYVNYRRTVYQAKARVLKAFLQQRLPLALGLDYRVGSHYATNDPRGNLSDYEMNLSASAGYRIGKHLTAAAEGYYGYGQENVSIGYKNDVAQNSLDNPLKATYIINGYSEPLPVSKQLSYRDYRKRKGAGFSLLHTVGRNTMALQGKWLRETQRYTFRADDGSSAPLAEYFLSTTSFAGVWNRQLRKGGITALLHYRQENGEDFHQVYRTHNYLYNAREYGGVLARTLYKNAATYNYGLRVRYNKLQYIDGAYSNNLRYRRVALSPSWGVSIRTAGRYTWGMDVNGSYEKALQPQAAISAVNASYFTREVIEHDYYYQTADVAGAGASVHLSRLFDGFNAGIQLKATYRRALQWNTREWPGAVYPGKDRFTMHAGVYFFF